MKNPVSSGIAAVIVAAGRGARAGGQMPKQWRPLAGRRVIDWTLAAFAAHPAVGRIVLVLAPQDMGLGESLAADPKITIAAGGATRGASVRAGLEALEGAGTQKVLIHDVARPCISRALIDRVIAALQDTPGAAPALAVTDALWTGADGQVTGTRDRSGLFRAQTPQGFDFQAILAAHRGDDGQASDDVEVARRAGLAVTIVEGEESNLKITHPGDFARAEAIVKEQQMKVRFGNGYDVHRFGPGDHVTLCGVKIAHERGLMGHSDADVAMHAITDALYGALAEGDIGQHFPPSDPQWKGAASRIFLEHAMARVAARGLKVANIDCTLVCEHPKIGPHAIEMRQHMSKITGIEMENISIKATTSEGLGFTGRGEGIAALATAALVSA